MREGVRERPARALLGWPVLARAAAVGLLVWLTARGFGSSSCSEQDTVIGASSCLELVSSLAVRVGVAAGVAMVMMELLAAGLLRTAAVLEEQRQAEADGAGDASRSDTR
jgi:hypothetical protein